MSDEPTERRDERIAELETENAQLRVALRAALKRIDVLERQLGINSRNSSQPPSLDKEKDRQKRTKKRKSGRSPGGQKGHEGHSRELLPEEDVDHFQKYFPTSCKDCGLELSMHDVIGEPSRHQVFELVPKLIDCTEHQAFCCRCPGCGESTRAELPTAIAQSGWGPRLTALNGALSIVCQDTRRMVDWFVSHVLGAPSSLGTVQAHLEEVSASLEPGYEQVRAALLEVQGGVGLDETGWRLGRLPYWIWVAESEDMALYLIRRGRTKEVAQELVGEFGARIFITDRYGSYSFLPISHHQLCHSHLLREFTAMASRDGPMGTIGAKLDALSRKLQRRWAKVKSGEMQRADFVKWAKRKVRPRWERLLKKAQALGDAPAVVEWFLKEGTDRLGLAWTFLDFEGVEPTNNSAERALRRSVIQRKISWGSKSESGLRLMERLWTLAETCRRQQRNLLDYITKAVEAFRIGAPAPILRLV